VLLPDDNFEGRSLSRLGVGETGSIKVEPIGSTLPTDIFPLQSFSSSDTGAFSMSPNLTEGKAKFMAGNEKGSTVVTAKDKNGNEETYSIDTVEPAGVRFEEHVPWRNMKDVSKVFLPLRLPAYAWISIPLPDTSRGAVLYCKMYVLPTDVSFRGVIVGESTVQATRYNGSLVDPRRNGEHAGWEKAAGRGNIALGCQVGREEPPNDPSDPGDVDRAWFERAFVPGNGELTWDIPWTYKTTNMASQKEFMKIRQEMYNIGDKKSTVSKGGNTAERIIP
jgi:hypothetical protein